MYVSVRVPTGSPSLTTNPRNPVSTRTSRRYRMSMKSVHGCPKQCAMTDNGLCNNHGHCGYVYVYIYIYIYICLSLYVFLIVTNPPFPTKHI